MMLRKLLAASCVIAVLIILVEMSPFAGAISGTFSCVWTHYDQEIIRGVFTLAAVVSGAFVATGQWRSRQKELRALRQSDTRDAIYAEVRDQWRSLMYFRLENSSTADITNKTMLPYLLPQPQPSFFDPGKIDISLLSSEEINWLSQYSQKIIRYNLAIETANDMRVANIPLSRKKGLVDDCYQQLMLARDLAERAMNVLEDELLFSTPMSYKTEKQRILGSQTHVSRKA
ncbi:MAG: hypothetical protein OXR62_08360 [Ahrensia sp.]|nr:hypothetical protein [Ahrensia sp.]